MTAVTGVPPVFVAGGALTARELLLPPPHADNSSDDESAKSKLSLACIWKIPKEVVVQIEERNDARIIGSSNGRWQCKKCRFCREKSCCAAAADA
jgi:hypothetical protein